MYDNDLVSVIIPVYNAERFIKQTIESVVNQTYRNIEIILVDDCSQDNSAGIIMNLQEKNENIVYHKQNKNQGAAVARNTALNLARGRYVAFLDSDDLWLPNKMQKQLNLMKEHEASFVYGAIEMINEEGKIVKAKRKVVDKINYNFLLKNTMIATSTVVIDRKTMGNFQMPLIRSGQDYATWLMLLRNGEVARGIDEVLTQYRLWGGSLSSNKFKSIQQVWTIQTGQENIDKAAAGFNIVCFTLNALKKYFF